ncbi:hypothetical protein NIBR502770_06530 [Pseudarthrobacter sp. NIBRBAC000502770]|nr:hypothetical protein NIBR502770_06530 [Pseudarthrobacter sp. NIBRBAC000502770]
MQREMRPHFACGRVPRWRPRLRRRRAPAFGDEGPSLAALAKQHTGLPVIANGNLDEPEAGRSNEKPRRTRRKRVRTPRGRQGLGT